MRGARTLSLLAALLLLLSACGGEPAREEADCVLWFPVSGSAVSPAKGGHGPALDWEAYAGEAESPGPEELLTALLAGPGSEELVSPFPRGVSLRSWEWDGERPGVLKVDLSEQYGALTDLSLTLADYCIVLTLSQVEGVEGVEITAGGHSVSYRSHQLLTAGEAVLWDELADAAP